MAKVTIYISKKLQHRLGKCQVYCNNKKIYTVYPDGKRLVFDCPANTTAIQLKGSSFKTNQLTLEEGKSTLRLYERWHHRQLDNFLILVWLLAIYFLTSEYMIYAASVLICILIYLAYTYSQNTKLRCEKGDLYDYL